MAAEPDNLVLEILRGMQGDLSCLKSDVASLKIDVAVIKDEMSLMKSDIAGIKHIQDDHTVKLVFVVDELLLIRTATVGQLRDAEENRDVRKRH